MMAEGESDKIKSFKDEDAMAQSSFEAVAPHEEFPKIKVGEGIADAEETADIQKGVAKITERIIKIEAEIIMKERSMIALKNLLPGLKLAEKISEIDGVDNVYNCAGASISHIKQDKAKSHRRSVTRRTLRPIKDLTLSILRNSDVGLSALEVSSRLAAASPAPDEIYVAAYLHSFSLC